MKALKGFLKQTKLSKEVFPQDPAQLTQAQLQRLLDLLSLWPFQEQTTPVRKDIAQLMK